MSPKSLTGRVTLAAVAAVGGALLVAGLAVIIFTARSDQAQLDRDLTRLSRQVDRRAGPVFSPPAAQPRRKARPGRPAREGKCGTAAPAVAENGPLEPSGDRFTRVVLANGQSYSGGATVPANFPLTTAGETSDRQRRRRRLAHAR